LLEQQKTIKNILEKIDNLSYDHDSIPQSTLDLINKKRTSIFPWRGQFSPQLVQTLLENYANKNSIVLDPFLGSGTTLFEASRKNISAYGAEINPSAIEMAKTIYFVNLDRLERQKLIKKVDQILDQNLLFFEYELFSCYTEKKCELQIIQDIITQENNLLIKNLLINATIRYFNYRQPKKINDFRKAILEQIEIIKNLPYSSQEYKVFHTDAKSIPLSNNIVDLVITSPPYINVFNYHQNNRSAMEFMGWNLLDIAKSEIGANRKHRQNRFLTVIQYSLDMLDVLKEIHRLLCPHGRCIMVVGRTSTVRNTKINNSRLVATLALGGANFKLDKIQERKFKNKFGEIIYEDILHLIPEKSKLLSGDNIAYLTAQSTLEEISNYSQPEVLDDILKAIKISKTVQKSPLFTLSQKNHQSLF